MIGMIMHLGDFRQSAWFRLGRTTPLPPPPPALLLPRRGAGLAAAGASTLTLAAPGKRQAFSAGSSSRPNPPPSQLPRHWSRWPPRALLPPASSHAGGGFSCYRDQRTCPGRAGPAALAPPVSLTLPPPQLPLLVGLVSTPPAAGYPEKLSRRAWESCWGRSTEEGGSESGRSTRRDAAPPTFSTSPIRASANSPRPRAAAEIWSSGRRFAAPIATRGGSAETQRPADPAPLHLKTRNPATSTPSTSVSCGASAAATPSALTALQPERNSAAPPGVPKAARVPMHPAPPLCNLAASQRHLREQRYCRKRRFHPPHFCGTRTCPPAPSRAGMPFSPGGLAPACPAGILPLFLHQATLGGGQAGLGFGPPWAK